ncbi:hypothetical protein BDV12DRAFT_79372 [Aspergillus spectabilis]
MFAAVAHTQQFSNPSHHPWTPARPSPLSPRRPSSSPATTITTTPIQQPQFSQSPSSLFTFSPSPSPSPSRIDHSTTTISSRTRTSNPNSNPNATSPTYATRYKTTISNPLLAHSTKRTHNASASPAARSVRRNAFLNRVKQDRESGRVEARAEQLAFLENVAEQKEWVEGMRRRADEIQARFGLGIEEEEYLDGGMSSSRRLVYFFQLDDGLVRSLKLTMIIVATEAEIQALDEYLEQEHAFEMELLEGVESGPSPSNGNGQEHGIHQPGPPNNTTSSFSDDEYDDIFMDLADPSPPQDTDMDISG